MGTDGIDLTKSVHRALQGDNYVNLIGDIQYIHEIRMQVTIVSERGGGVIGIEQTTSCCLTHPSTHDILKDGLRAVKDAYKDIRENLVQCGIALGIEGTRLAVRDRCG